MTIANKITIIGISPRNSYFTKANIGFALDALLQQTTNVLVFIPDTLDIHNYIAYGYEEAKACKKAKGIGLTFRKVVHELCTARHYSCSDSGHAQAQVRIINWHEDVANKHIYKESLKDIEKLYQVNAAFKHDVREASLSSIQSRINYDPSLQSYFDKTGIEKGIDHAVHYILSELAFLNVASKLFGGKKTEYVYHREWPVYERYISGKYEGNQRPQLALKIVTNPLAVS